jgi:hypothetical protein
VSAAQPIVLPDVEKLVCDALKTAMPFVDVGTTLVGWQAGRKHLLVRRTGGKVRYRWLDEAEVLVEARAADRASAAQLAADARAVLAALPTGPPPAGAVVPSVDEVRGPGWMPDPDGGGRYQQLWQIKTHPQRGG